MVYSNKIRIYPIFYLLKGDYTISSIGTVILVIILTIIAVTTILGTDFIVIREFPEIRYPVSMPKCHHPHCGDPKQSNPSLSRNPHIGVQQGSDFRSFHLI